MARERDEIVKRIGPRGGLKEKIPSPFSQFFRPKKSHHAVKHYMRNRSVTR